LTLSGLTGTDSNDSDSLHFKGHGLFDFVSWSQEPGDLVFQVFNDTEARELYNVSFVVVNPPHGQESPTISIQSGGAIVIAPVDVDSADGNEAPLLVADFVVRDIGQSTASASAKNTITITIETSVLLEAGNRIVFTGLEGNTFHGEIATFSNFTFNTSYVCNTTNTSIRRPWYDTPLEHDRTWNATCFNNCSLLNSTWNASSITSFINASCINTCSNSTGNISCFNNCSDPIPFCINNCSEPYNRTWNATSLSFDNSSTPLPYVPTWIDTCVDTCSSTRMCGSVLCASRACNNALLEGSNLTITLTEALEPDSMYVLSFFITNPAARQDSPSTSIQALGLVKSAALEMRSGPANYAPLLVAGFNTARIIQRNYFASENNTLVVTLNSNAILLEGSEIVISGLKGMQPKTMIGIPLDLHGSAAGTYSSRAQWDGTRAVLRVFVISDMASHQNYTFSFTLTNAPTGHLSYDIRIRVVRSTVTSPIFMSKGPGWMAPTLVLFEFTTAFASHTTTKPGALNRVFFTLVSRENITGSTGVEIIISGLTGTGTEGSPNSCGNSCITVLPGECEGVGRLRRSAAWDQLNGTLILSVVRDIQANIPFGFSFEIQNANYSQPSPEIFVMAEGVPMLPRRVDVPDNNRAPLLTAGFKSALMEQNSPYVSTENVLNVTFSTRVSLTAVAETKITISGLRGFETRSTHDLEICSVKSEPRFPNTSRGFDEELLKGHEGFCTNNTFDTPNISAMVSVPDGYEYIDTMSHFRSSRCQFYSQVLSRAAHWNRTKGELVLSIIRDTEPGEQYTILLCSTQWCARAARP